MGGFRVSHGLFCFCLFIGGLISRKAMVKSIAFFVLICFKSEGGSSMAIPSLEDFKRLAAQGNLIPVFEEVHFDWETPISAFRKIEEGRFSFLLESAEGGEKWGRYSFLGSNPSYIFRSKGDILYCFCQEGKRTNFIFCKNSELGNASGFR